MCSTISVHLKYLNPSEVHRFAMGKQSKPKVQKSENGTELEFDELENNEKEPLVPKREKQKFRFSRQPDVSVFTVDPDDPQDPLICSTEKLVLIVLWCIVGLFCAAVIAAVLKAIG